MATSPDFHPRSSLLPSLAGGSSVWWLVAPLAIVVLIAYCELHSLVTGMPPAGLDVSAPWAARVAAGWIVAGALVLLAAPRIMSVTRVAEHPRIAVAFAILAIALFTLVCEWLMTTGSRWQGLPAYLYDRAPLHCALAALLLAVLVPRRARSHPQPPTPVALPAADAAKDPAARRQDVATRALEVMTGTGKTSICIDEIERIEADGNYLNVRHTNGRCYLLRQTLTCAERSLPPAQFVRIHRSTIVNRDMIRERRSGGVLVLRSGQTVRVGRAYRDQAALSTPPGG